MQITTIFTLHRNSSCRIEGHKCVKMSTVPERPFAMAWGISSTLILPRSSMW